MAWAREGSFVTIGDVNHSRVNKMMVIRHYGEVVLVILVTNHSRVKKMAMHSTRMVLVVERWRIVLAPGEIKTKIRNMLKLTDF